jgi:hypothetical protein
LILARARRILNPAVGIGNRIGRTWRAAALLAVGAVGGGAAFAVASVPDGTGTIHACVNAAPGQPGVPATTGPNLTVIDPAANQHCTTSDPAGGPPSQIPLNWNVTGPAGAPGARGPAGVAGSPGTGNTYSVVLAPPVIPRGGSSFGQVTVNPGPASFSFPLLSGGFVFATGFSIGSGGSSGKTQLHDFHIVKPVDKASPTLFAAAVSGKHFSSVKITLRKAGKPFETIKLSDVLISSLQQSLTASSKTAVDNLTFSYVKLTVAFK